MATPSENLAASLEVLKSLQEDGNVAIRANHLSRTHRERLAKNGFIREVVKGWYIPANPDEVPGESTAWYTTFWAFCADYLDERFGQEWCLSPEQSLTLWTGDWTVPKQLLVRSPKGGNKPLALPYGTSIFDVRLELPPAADMQVNNGLRAFNLPAGLIATSPTHFAAQPIVMRAALAAINDASDVLGRLLDGGHSTIAGRLAGAFRNIGRDSMANSIAETMRTAGYTVNETDPFKGIPHAALGARETSPYVNRVTMMWQRMREDVLAHFPAPAKKRPTKTAYLKHVEEVYVTDAYNSLSIEGYRVNTALIERIHSGEWNADTIEADRNHKDALAARGYWQAFQRVKQSVGRVLDGENAGEVAHRDHGAWYRELFGPSITAGLLRPSDLAGYRNGPIYIRRSMHVPPNRDAVRELMPAFFDLLENEPEPAVRVVLGHFIFVYIHPYYDGNGRIGRFLMNVMLASGGYPWTVVPVKGRDDYMAALEKASVEGDIIPFTQHLGNLLKA
ncbi:MAG: Fic family protein [Ramlibacter sp.]|nr:Fic family protein [Ramlibacter sp.]